MTSEQATMVFAGVMSFGAVVWITSLIKALRMGRARRPPDYMVVDDVDRSRYDEDTGEIVVQGESGALCKSFRKALRTSNFGVVAGLYRIEPLDDDRLTMVKTGALMCNQPASLYFSEADFAFDQTGHDQVKVSYRLGFVRFVRTMKTITLAIILGAGLPVMLITGGLIWSQVINSDNPTIRWQVFQSLQIAHGLWPPFLVMWFYSLGRRQSKSFVENLIYSLDEE